MALAYTPALLARATAYLAAPLPERRSPVGLAELLALYNAITGEGRSWCPQCQYSDFYALVQAYCREASTFLAPRPMSESKYTVADGYEKEEFVHEHYNKVVTADNLTDEDAEFFLAHGGEHLFVLKAGQQAESKAEEADKKPALRHKADYQARFAEVFGQEADEKLTIAQLTEHLDAREADAAYALPTA